jgi:hypothetical protein
MASIWESLVFWPVSESFILLDIILEELCLRLVSGNLYSPAQHLRIALLLASIRRSMLFWPESDGLDSSDQFLRISLLLASTQESLIFWSVLENVIFWSVFWYLHIFVWPEYKDLCSSGQYLRISTSSQSSIATCTYTPGRHPGV